MELLPSDMFQKHGLWTSGKTCKAQNWLDNQTSKKKFIVFNAVIIIFFSTMSEAAVERANLNAPKWDQNTFQGRAKHFFVVTNPLNLFCSSGELDKAKELVQLYK